MSFIHTKKFIYMALALLLVFSLTGCAKTKTAKSDGKNCIYYVDTDRKNLVAEDYTADKEDPIGTLIKDLQKNPENADYQSAFMGGVEIEDYELKDSDLEIHLSSEYKKMSTSDAMLLRAAVVKSATALDQVDYCLFYVKDKPLKDKSGKEVGYLNEESFLDGVGSSLQSVNSEKFELYQVDGDKLKVTAKTLKYNQSELKERALAEKVTPVSTKLLGVTVTDSVCYVNFDEEFLNGVADEKPELSIYSIVNTITENSSVSQVQILVNGKVTDSYMDAVDISKPLTFNSEVVKK